MKMKFFKVRLKVLLFGFALILGVTVFARNLYFARLQVDAKEWVESQGGHVYYDFQPAMPAGAVDYRSRPENIPKFLIDLFGIDFFCEIRGVVCWDSSNDGVVKPKNLNGLQRLEIRHAKDDDIHIISEFSSLQVFVTDSLDQAQAELLSKLPDLRVLYLLNYDGDNLEPFGKIGTLEELYIRENNADDIDLEKLKNCTDLKVLDLGICTVGGSTVNCQGLEKFKKLERFGAQLCQLKNIRSINKIKNLNSLDLMDSFKDVQPDLQKLKSVRHLNLGYIDAPQLEFLPNPEQLKTLCFLLDSREINIEKLPALPNLETLSISVDFQSFDIGWISKLKRLKRLNLQAAGSGSLDVLSEVSQLEELALEGFHSVDFTQLENLKNLRKLTVSEGQVRNIEILQRLEKLEELTLIGVQVRGSKIKEGAILKLKALELRNVDFSRSSFFVNAEYPNLRSFSLTHDKEAPVKIDFSQFNSMPNLKVLLCRELKARSLSFSKIDFLKKFPKLQYLSVFSETVSSNYDHKRRKLTYKPAANVHFKLRKFELPPEEFLLPMRTSRERYGFP